MSAGSSNEFRDRTCDAAVKPCGPTPRSGAHDTGQPLAIVSLNPDIISAILGGRHPPELTARRFMDDTLLSLDWNEQRHLPGFVSTC